MSETCHIVLSGIGRIIIAVGPTALWVGLFLFTILYFQHPIRAFLKRATGIEAFGAKILAESIERIEGQSMLEGTVGQFMQNDMAVPYTYNLPATPNPHNVYFFKNCQGFRKDTSKVWARAREFPRRAPHDDLIRVGIRAHEAFFVRVAV